MNLQATDTHTLFGTALHQNTDFKYKRGFTKIRHANWNQQLISHGNVISAQS